VASGLIELAISSIGVSLEDPSIVDEMSLRMLAASIARVIEHSRRRILSPEGAVVTGIDPAPCDVRFALGQHRHSRIVAMQAMGGQRMGLQALEERIQSRAAGPNLIGQSRQAQLNPLTGVALSLPVQRLMLTKLLEEDHGEQAGASPAARNHMERRRSLANGLTIAARELLAHMLDDLPLAGDHLQRLGDILAQLGQTRATAASAGCWPWNDNSLPGQVLRERLARRPLAGEGRDIGRLDHGGLGGKLILGGRGLQFFQLQFKLVQKTRTTL
jgi:hypothetical protein